MNKSKESRSCNCGLGGLNSDFFNVFVPADQHGRHARVCPPTRRVHRHGGHFRVDLDSLTEDRSFVETRWSFEFSPILFPIDGYYRFGGAVVDIEFLSGLNKLKLYLFDTEVLVDDEFEKPLFDLLSYFGVFFVVGGAVIVAHERTDGVVGVDLLDFLGNGLGFDTHKQICFVHLHLHKIKLI